MHTQSEVFRQHMHTLNKLLHTITVKLVDKLLENDNWEGDDFSLANTI